MKHYTKDSPPSKGEKVWIATLNTSHKFPCEATVTGIGDGKPWSGVWVEYQCWMTEINNGGGWESIIKTRTSCFPFEKVFPYTLEGNASCYEYCMNKYRDGLCDGCKYADKGSVVRCENCAHFALDEKHEFFCDALHTDAIVWAGEDTICRLFEPKYEGFKREYGDFNGFMDCLKHCVHNPDCPHHRGSIFKAKAFDDWMDNLVSLKVAGRYNGEDFDRVYITRKTFFEADFINENGDIKNIVAVNRTEKTRNGRRTVEWYVPVPDGKIKANARVSGDD